MSDQLDKKSILELMVAEMVPQVPGQLALDGEEQDHPKILKFKRQA